MDERDKQNLLAAIAVIVIVGLSLWLIHAMSESIKLQNCVMSGRRNCNPISLDQ